MNKDAWFKQPNNRSTYEYKYVHRLLNAWKQQNGITKQCVVHHRDDNDEVKSYNESHYERWGLNPDGTFEYGKYVLFMTQSEHTQYHHKGEKSPHYGKRGEGSPNYGKTRSDETKAKISAAHKGEKNPMYGQHHSDEAKEKMSIAKQGRIPSEETKEKMSQSAKERMQIISGAYKKYKLEGGTLTWRNFIKQYSNQYNKLQYKA